MAVSLVMEAGRTTGKDRVTQSNKTAYIGDPSTSTAGATRRAVTTTYQDRSELEAGTPDAVIDLYDCDTLMLLVDFNLDAATDGRIKVSFGEDDDRAKLNTQETREDNGTANQVKHESIEHVLTATFRGYIEIPRLSRYCKIDAKATGSPGASDTMAIAYFGQDRE